MVSKFQYLRELYDALPGDLNSSDVWIVESECFEQGYFMRAEKDGDKKTIRFIGMKPPKESLRQLVANHFHSLFEYLVRQQEVRAVEQAP
jgi:hypothetical protein